MVFRSTNGHRSAVGFNGRYKLISTNGGNSWSLYDLVFDYDENSPIATNSNISSRNQATQDVYNQLLDELNARFGSIGSGLNTSIANDYESRIASATGVNIQAEPPENVDLGDRPNNTPDLFIERQYATVLETLVTDSDGTVGTHNITGEASLAAGTVVNSYLVFHDPVSNNNQADFEITFEDKIVAVIGTGSILPESDYLSFADPNFGTLAMNPGDSWTISKPEF